MSSLYHLRIDVRRIQGYIFQVPRLKYMLGANSKIGELFDRALPDFIGTPKCLISTDAMNLFTSGEQDYPELKEQFAKNILSSSGGHFEALFSNQAEMLEMFTLFTEYADRELPDLEYSASYREFDPEKNYEDFKKAEIKQLHGISGIAFPDSPYFQLCANDGVSTALSLDKNALGLKSELMFAQAKRFYALESKDALSKFLANIGVKSASLADTLEDLAKSGKSRKRNMLAYIRLDGNGTGERYRELSSGLKDENVLTAFAKIEMFWYNNRQNIRKALQEVLSSELVQKYEGSIKPYLPLMLGGDDLFMVCVPELALDLVLELCEKLEQCCPISAGIAFTKTNYPIGLAAKLAESCLESAKAASYRKDAKTKPSFIDWHIHFDSFFQEVEDIRRNSYMLDYQEEDKRIIELLCDRPYPTLELKTLLGEVKKVATDLDRPEGERANNKIKGLRSVLKDGYAEVDYFKSMIVKDDEKLNKFLGTHTTLYEWDNKTVKMNSALDKIELIEFYRKETRSQA